jgi:hypothetical protein
MAPAQFDSFGFRYIRAASGWCAPDPAKCSKCGDELETIVVRNMAGDLLINTELPCPRIQCQPDPEPQKLRRWEEDRWLAKHLALAQGHYS